MACARVRKDTAWHRNQMMDCNGPRHVMFAMVLAMQKRCIHASSVAFSACAPLATTESNPLLRLHMFAGQKQDATSLT